MDHLKTTLLAIVISAVITFGLTQLIVPNNVSGATNINEQIATYIQENPEAILESVNNHQRKQREASLTQAGERIAESKKALEDNENSPSIGNKDADVVVVEFFDYACGYCKKVFPELMRLSKEDSDIRIVFKEFPVLGKNSEIAARIGLAGFMTNPDKYLELHEALMKNRVTSQESGLKIASDIGFDRNTLSEKMTSKEVEEELSRNRELAAEIGIRGTPAFIIGESFVPGYASYDQLKDLVKKARK